MATVEAAPHLIAVGSEYEQLFRAERTREFCDFFNSLDEDEYVPPPNEQSIANAWQLFCRLNRHYLLPTKYMPSPQGGVALCFSRQSGRYADFECFNDGITMAATSDGHGNVEVFHVGLDNDEEVDRAIFRISQFLDAVQNALPLAAVR